MIRFNEKEYGSEKQILMFPDNYVCFPQKFSQDSSLAIEVGSRKIIKAGTIYPANDATAQGVVFSDLDVTEGDVNGAVLVFGFVKTSALPVEPSQEAKAALNMIKFFPLADQEVLNYAKYLRIS